MREDVVAKRALKSGLVSLVGQRIGRGRRASIIAVAALTATAGIASATIPNAGVIEACYTRSGGSLRVIDRSVTNCSKNETSLSWNVQGVQGEPGPAGPAGPQGPAGPAGISAGFGAVLTEQLEITTAAVAGQVVISKAAPAGNYVLVARVDVQLSGAAFTGVHCWIPGDRVVVYLGDSGVGLEEVLTLTSAVAHPGGALELRCAKSLSNQGNFHVSNASFTGVQVATLN